MSEATAQRLADDLVAGMEANGTNADWVRAASLLASRVRQSEDYAAKCERQRHEIARLNTANATLTRRVEELEGVVGDCADAIESLRSAVDYLDDHETEALEAARTALAKKEPGDA